MYFCQMKHDDKISGLMTPSGCIQKRRFLSELQLSSNIKCALSLCIQICLQVVITSRHLYPKCVSENFCNVTHSKGKWGCLCSPTLTACKRNIYPPYTSQWELFNSPARLWSDNSHCPESLSPTTSSPCYRYIDSVAGHLLPKLLSHPPFLPLSSLFFL